MEFGMEVVECLEMGGAPTLGLPPQRGRVGLGYILKRES